MTEQKAGLERTKILVLDDDPDRAAATVAEVRQGLSSHVDKYEITPVSGPELKEQIELMFDIYRALLEGKNVGRSPFEAEIAIVDYNLSEIQFRGAIHTADTIVGYARTISKDIYFVSLNRNETVDFDLRYAIGDYDSKSDASLNSNHLCLPSLWSEDSSRSEFRPWYWPVLGNSQDRRQKLLSYIGQNIESGVLDTLGLSDLDIEALSLHAKGFLESALPHKGRKSFRDVTFMDVFRSTGRTISQDDRAKILKFTEERTIGIDPICQVVAHEIDVWLRRDIIGGQDVLVDIPHLVERYPFLLGDRVGDESAWAALPLSSEDACSMLRRGGHWGRLEKYLLSDWQIWSDRPVFRWKSIDADDEMVGISLNFEWKEGLDLVFAEDISRFVNKKSARRFNLETETSYPSRYVKIVDDFNYVPMSRLSS